jgi:GNAT superfamily N-acetyltransferase
VADHPLVTILGDAVDGRPPPADGTVTVLPQPPGKVAAILAFAAHHVIAADVEPAWVHERLPPGDLGAPMGAPFVAALSEHLGVGPSSLDVVLAGTGTGRGAGGLLQPAAERAHPRATRSERYRTESTVFETSDGTGVLIIGRGLAGRWEAAFEVDEASRGRGLGRRLVATALDLVPPGEPLFVAVAPGNVPSLRAVLATGVYAVIGGELLFPVGAGP